MIYFRFKSSKLLKFEIYKIKFKFCNGSLAHCTKKWSFTLRISSVNVTKSAICWGFGHIYRRNLSWKTYFLCSGLYLPVCRSSDELLLPPKVDCRNLMFALPLGCLLHLSSSKLIKIGFRKLILPNILWEILFL